MSGEMSDCCERFAVGVRRIDMNYEGNSGQPQGFFMEGDRSVAEAIVTRVVVSPFATHHSPLTKNV